MCLKFSLVKVEKQLNATDPFWVSMLSGARVSQVFIGRPRQKLPERRWAAGRWDGDDAWGAVTADSFSRRGLRGPGGRWPPVDSERGQYLIREESRTARVREADRFGWSEEVAFHVN